jgi:hypothetical protein
MPHVDVKFKEGSVSGDKLFRAADQIVALVARHFYTIEDYVSLEIIPQTKWTKNRKDIDVELRSSPDPEGKRQEAIGTMANTLADWLQVYLRELGIHCQISVMVQVFPVGTYEFRES